MEKQNQCKSFKQRCACTTIILANKITQTLTSSWSIGAIIAAVSAWTAGIFYV